ncbi:MAG: ATP-binding protein [Bacteroidota bacterium]
MDFKDIPGLDHIKKHLLTTTEQGRIPHAQLFVGKNGSGTLPTAIAFAKEIIARNLLGDAKRLCLKKIDQLNHPDLHFVYPVNSTDKIKKNPIAKDFYREWRDFAKQQPFGELFDWYQAIEIEKKQGLISVHQAADIVKTLSLKSYEGNAKVMIIWAADKMNNSAANKLLKLIEEPPKDTFFILITDAEEQILQTIRSRCQRLDFPPLSEENIASYLQQTKNIEASKAMQIAHQSDGNMSKALELAANNSDDEVFESWFIQWVRTAFRAKGNKSVVKDLSDWSTNLAKENRETQKRFLAYCIHFFRQALLKNYSADSLVFMQTYDSKFKFDGFAKFIHGKNIEAIFTALEEANYHIERNANSKIVLTDLSMQLTRLIHQK